MVAQQEGNSTLEQEHTSRLVSQEDISIKNNNNNSLFHEELGYDGLKNGLVKNNNNTHMGPDGPDERYEDARRRYELGE